MATNRVDRILGEWSAVARTATPPTPPAPAIGARQGLGVSLLGAVALALVVVAALAWLGGRDELPSVGGLGESATPVASSIAPSDSPGPSPSPNLDASPTPAAPTQEQEPTPAPPSPISRCDPAELAPRITQWEGAAGSRIAHVQVTNTTGAGCETPDIWQTLLLDANGQQLIAGDKPAFDSFVIVPSGGTVTGLVLVNNYCGPTPVEPVSIAFVVDGTQVTATTDPEVETPLPPCNGAGQPATIEMTAWGL